MKRINLPTKVIGRWIKDVTIPSCGFQWRPRFIFNITIEDTNIRFMNVNVTLKENKRNESKM